MYCWGKNLNNQVGNSSTTADITTPYRVANTGFFYVSAGYDNTCAITYNASATLRSLRCFGSSDYGKLGYGGTSDTILVMIDRDIKNTSLATIAYNAVALGRNHSCSISTATSRDSDDSSPLAQYSVRCAGGDRSGQLGQGDSSDVITPAIVENFTVASGGPQQFNQISYGYRNACGLNAAGDLFCWGSAANKLIGDGASSGSSTPFGFQRSGPTKIDHGTSYAKVDVGTQQACAITSAGTLRCWGENSSGQIGIGNVDLSAPVTINAGQVYSEVSVGDGHICAITSAVALQCWGANSTGQVGNSSTTLQTKSTPIDSGETYLKVSAGTFHTCAISTSNKLKCWGDNTYGQLGLGNTSSQITPTAVDAGNDYIDVVAAETHTCAIRKVTASTGQVFCWGNNLNGQLGINTTGGTALTPSQILDSGGSPITDQYNSITAGINHTCAIRTDSQAQCWGYNTSGQLGDSTRVNRSFAAAVSVGLVSKLASGGDSTCAIEQSNNVLKCFGYDEFGNIGLRRTSTFYKFVPGL